VIISDVEVHVVAPAGTDEVIAGSRLGWVFVSITTDTGLVGFGECSNWARNSNAIIGAALNAVRETLIGRDPRTIEKLWHEIFRHYTYLGNRGLVTTVLSGIDIALWDLKGKALGAPIHDLLGGAVRDDLLLYTHPGGATGDEAAANTRALLAAGFSAFKYDPFSAMIQFHTEYLSGDIARADVRWSAEYMHAVRAEVGPDVELLIDFHGNYNAASALRCIQALQDLDITWFEEPFPPEGLAALRQLRGQTDQPLCVGERHHTRWDFAPVLAEGLVNYVMPDVCWTGGISELKKIATLAEVYFVPVAPHGALGPLQAIAGAHVMLTVPNFYRLEILAPQYIAMYDEYLTAPLDVAAGRLRLSDRPGLGVDLDLDAVRAHADPDWPPRS